MRRDEQKIVLVSGKGGVGKTAIASALALRYAHEGKATLLAELGERSFLRHIFPTFSGQQVHRITDELWATRWSGESCLREYLLHYLKVEKIVDLFFSNRSMRALLGAAPALADLSVLGKVTSGPRGVGPDMPYEVVVVDGYSTGHFRALLRAPVGMAQAIPFGPMGEQSRSMSETLRSSNTQVILVTLPEELPVTETLEHAKLLREEFAIEPHIILNRNWALPLNDEEMVHAKVQLEVMKLSSSALGYFWAELEERGRRQEWALGELNKAGLETSIAPQYMTLDWLDLVRRLSKDLRP